jgi:3-oxoacyl-[acyl-carrier protein] reductase
VTETDLELGDGRTLHVYDTGADDARGVLAYMEGGSLLGRLPTLEEVGNAAVFLASDRAGTMTGTVANLTCGSVVD